MPASHTSGIAITSELSKKEEIRRVVEGFLSKIHAPYVVTPYAQDFHNLCCKIARERGYPMGTDVSVPSLLPYMKTGVVVASTAYGHIDEARRVYICLFTAFIAYVDGIQERDHIQHISVFMEQFIRHEKQLDPILDGAANLLLDTPDYFAPEVASIIVASTISMINATVLEFQTQGMKISMHAKHYPESMRQMTGLSYAYAAMIFPQSIPIQNYIQCLPDAEYYINYTNDVLSFYKEELAGDTVNYVSALAKCQGIMKMEVLEDVANDASKADVQVGKILGEAEQATTYLAWQKFRTGYVEFHTSQCDRYHLEELMN